MKRKRLHAEANIIFVVVVVVVVFTYTLSVHRDGLINRKKKNGYIDVEISKLKINLN